MSGLLQPCILYFCDVKVTYRCEDLIVFFFPCLYVTFTVYNLYWLLQPCNLYFLFIWLPRIFLVFMFIVRFRAFLVTYRCEEKIFFVKLGVLDLLPSVICRLSRLQNCYEIYIISSSGAHKSFGELKVINGWYLASVADSNWENGNLDGRFRTMSSKYHGYYLLHSIHMVSWFSWCTQTLSMTWNC